MLGLDACELGAQLLELLRLALCARGERAWLGPGRPRGRGAQPGAGRLLPRGNFGGARGDLAAGVGGFVQATHGARGQEWAGL